MLSALYNGHFGRHMWAFYDIAYQYFAPEYDSGGHLTCNGYLLVRNVRVVTLEWRGRDGRLRSKRDFGSWQKDVNACALEQIRREVEEWGFLADFLVERAELVAEYD